MIGLGAAVAYLITAFAGSAMLVRYAPSHHFARQLRRRLWLFPLAPVLLVWMVLQFALACVRWISRKLVGLFEALSGRRQYLRWYYTSYGYETPCQGQGKRSGGKGTAGELSRRDPSGDAPD